jgi:hypothetical protein
MFAAIEASAQRELKEKTLQDCMDAMRKNIEVSGIFK